MYVIMRRRRKKKNFFLHVGAESAAPLSFQIVSCRGKSRYVLRIYSSVREMGQTSFLEEIRRC
jgi:hypothetical protein